MKNRMKLPVFKRNRKLIFPANTSRYIETLPDGSYVLDIRKEKSKATQSMFGYLYGYLYPEILKEMGEFQTKENVEKLDVLFKKEYGVTHVTTEYVAIAIRGFDEQAIQPVESVEPKSKRDYTVGEMENYWTAIQKFAAEFLGLILKDPDPEWKEKWPGVN